MANPVCKRLLLKHVFDAGATRVEILTDALNARSCASIETLDAAFEGLMRKHEVTWTGRVRDTALYAGTDADWCRVRDGLPSRLSELAGSAT